MSELEDWTRRIEDTVGRIARLMQTDAARFVRDTLREAFVAADAPTQPDAVARLKADTMDAARRIADTVYNAILAVNWLDAAPEERSDPPRITDVPSVAGAVEALVEAVAEQLRAAGYPDAITYQLPQRFIDHDALPSLTRTLFKALDQYAALHAAEAARKTAQSAAARRQLWEDA